MNNKVKNKSRSMKPNGRSSYDGGLFLKALHGIFDHPDYISMKPTAKALLWDLARQYNLKNNGDLTLAPKVMRKWGWSKSTIDRHKSTLLDNNWIFITGHKPARNGFTYLYGLTWEDIDECGGKLYPESYKHKRRSIRF
ncbi:hypothetical protein [Alteromonas sp. W364]|uniref:hypothetical protein n=1 Tax=Alteromonas sp. W364 TaxID=3075610 RepID=UPI002886BF93|nr:hypothetical protein [Alteromonas sp. W364]MDT0626885.1 hypothetical protein [Alteromonas sp. W364]